MILTVTLRMSGFFCLDILFCPTKTKNVQTMSNLVGKCLTIIFQALHACMFHLQDRLQIKGYIFLWEDAFK